MNIRAIVIGSLLALPVWAGPVQIAMEAELRKSTCRDALVETVVHAFEQLGAQDGMARIGRIQVLAGLLENAGMDKTRAAAIGNTYAEVISGQTRVPGLESLVRWHMLYRAESGNTPSDQRIVACLLSADCTEARHHRNHAVFPDSHQVVIIGPVPTGESDTAFLINLFGSLELAAGNYALRNWAIAGYQLSAQGAKVDEYWPLFVQASNGDLNANESFMLFALRMRAERLSASLFAHLHASDPQLIEANNRHFEDGFRRDYESMPPEMRQVVGQLRVLENGYLHTAARVGDAMEKTTLTYISSN